MKFEAPSTKSQTSRNVQRFKNRCLEFLSFGPSDLFVNSDLRFRAYATGVSTEISTPSGASVFLCLGTAPPRPSQSSESNIL